MESNFGFWVNKDGKVIVTKTLEIKANEVPCISNFNKNKSASFEIDLSEEINEETFKKLLGEV